MRVYKCEIGYRSKIHKKQTFFEKNDTHQLVTYGQAEHLCVLEKELAWANDTTLYEFALLTATSFMNSPCSSKFALKIVLTKKYIERNGKIYNDQMILKMH